MTKICIDGFNLALPKGTGIATYGRNLARDYQSIGQDCAVLLGADVLGTLSKESRQKALIGDISPRRFNKYWRIFNKLAPIVGRPENPRLVGNSSSRIWSNRLPKNCELWHINNLYKESQKYFNLNGRLLEVALPEESGIYLTHWTSPIPVFSRNMPNITTIHDIIPLTHPSLTKTNVERYRHLLKTIIDRSEQLITVSEYSRTLIADHFNIDEKVLVNTYQSIDTSHTRVPEILEQNHLNQREYFIFTGALEPKKNISRMLKAYEASKSRLPLVVVAHGGWDNENDLALLRDMSNQERVIWLPYLDRDRLMTLIANAKALVFVSLVEGFGLPAAEAIDLGTPVMAADIPVLREICGDSAIYVSPLSSDEIVDGFRSIDSGDDNYRSAFQNARLGDSRFSANQHAARLGSVVRSTLR